MLIYQHRGKLHEIHFIDSPGFDDGNLEDAAILKRIADYVNTNYLLKKRLAGVLYLHDITKAKFGNVALRNIRLLEELIGFKNFNHCILVTTKWSSINEQAETQREDTLRTDPRYFGTMLENGSHEASLRRFDPKTKDSALNIISPFLEERFTPQITREMVGRDSPKLALGGTGAGKLVVDYLKQLARMKLELEKVSKEAAILSERYDHSLFLEFKQKRKELRRKVRLQQSGRWVARTTIIGGAITASVLTVGPGAAAFALLPMYEEAVRGQRSQEKSAKRDLEKQFQHQSQSGNQLKSVDPQWLWDSKVQNMDDLTSEGYSVRSTSSVEVLKVIKRGTTVGFATDGDASEGFEEMIGKTPLDSESDYDSDLDSE